MLLEYSLSDPEYHRMIIRFPGSGGNILRRYTNNKKSRLSISNLHASNICILALIALLVAASAMINRSLKPVVMSMAKQKGALAVSEIVNEAVTGAFEDDSIGYSDLVSLKYNDSGFVTSAEYNAHGINRLKLEISERLIKGLEKLRASKIKVPLGSASGDVSLNGRGPGIRIRIVSDAVPNIQLISSFESVGINTVKHDVILRVKVDSKVYLPPAEDDFCFTQDFVIAQTIIVGNIPEGYASIG